jgi:beta-barrel assembly-enhancing protease
MKFIFTTVILIAAFVGSGQDFNQYKTTTPQGSIPKDFTDRTSDKVQNELTSIRKERGSYRKAKQKFYLESTFSIDDFLTSGNVLFNDDITVYLNSVLAEILKPYPDLQKKVRVYTVKSSVVNAFTTNNGIIFVNLGLVARLENEAQLAFILAHEVVHFQKQHIINSYVSSVNIDSRKGDYRKLSLNEREFTKSSYSKELESEADLLGLEIFLKSSYDTDSIYTVFDVLKMADYPVGNPVFSKERFETKWYVFPDTFNVKVDAKIPYEEEDYDDSGSSHPNIRKRKESILLNLGSDRKGDSYRVSKKKFFVSRKMAQFELCRQYLLDHKYLRSLTLALALQEKDPSSTYLKQTVAKALYGLALDKLGASFENDTEEWIGGQQRVAKFIEYQSSYELCVLAIKQLSECLEASPGNVEISLMLNDIIGKFAREENDLSKRFLRNSSQKEIKQLRYSYTQNAFLQLKNPESFFKNFDMQVELAGKKDDEKSKRKKRLKHEPLDVNKIVFVNPVYKKLDRRKKQKARHAESEAILIGINDKINEAAGKLNIATDIINPNNLTSADIKGMQSNAILNDWINEYMNSGESKRVSPIHNEALALANLYKTDHFVWMGAMSVIRKNRGKVLYSLTGIALPSTIPLSLAKLFVPHGNTLYFALAFNLRTHQLELLDLRVMAMRDTESLMLSNIYYTLFKLKK